MRLTRKLLLILVVMCVWSGAGALFAFSPMLFSAAQRWADACVLVRAHVGSSGQVSLSVLRTVFGHVGRNDVLVSNPASLSGSRLIDGHSYLILLARDGQPIRTDSNDTNGPIYFCGVINTLEVVGEAVVDMNLYDITTGTNPKQAPLSGVVLQLRLAHEGKGGV